MPRKRRNTGADRKVSEHMSGIKWGKFVSKLELTALLLSMQSSVTGIFEFCDELLDIFLDLDQYVANYPFTGISATVGDAQFAGTIGSWLLPKPI